jgi:hypothetical protein
MRSRRRSPARSASERRRDLAPWGLGPACLLLLCWLLLLAPAARADSLQVKLTPEAKGPGVTLGFGFDLGGAAPLTSVALHFPPGLSYATSALGMAECSEAKLEAQGVAGCPPNSVIGDGTATVRVPFGAGTLSEKVDLTLFVGHTEGEAQEVLYYAVGSVPVISELVFRAEIGTASSGSSLVTHIPAINTLPGAPNAAVVSLQSRLDPPGLTYTRIAGHKEVHYHPQGMILPACPRKGFGFGATFRFEDDTSSSAHSTVACGRPGRNDP